MSQTETPATPATPEPGLRTGRYPATIALAVVADTVLVLVFAAIGRASHDEGGAVVGTLSTAWPFLAGLAAGWLIVLATARTARRTPRATDAARTGVVVWIATVAGGMLLRAAVGEGTAFTFILVATAFNLLTLVGWRLLAALTVRAARRTR